MLTDFLNLKGSKSISKKSQKTINGGKIAYECNVNTQGWMCELGFGELGICSGNHCFPC